MNALGFLLEKEAKQLFRNRIFGGILICYTLLVLFLFPFAINYDLKNVPISIVNLDGGSHAQRLINKIEGNPYFIIKGLGTSYETAMEDIEAHRSLAILVIPKDFSKEIIQGSSNVQVMINSVDGVTASIAMNYLSELISEYGSELLIEWSGSSLNQSQRLEIKPLYKYNKTLNYRFFMLPALIVILVTMYSGIFPGIMIVQEKEIGTHQQISVTPVARSTFILSKIIPYWVIAQFVIALSVAVLYFIHGLPLAGNYFLLMLCTFVFSVAMSFLGVIISNYSETLQQSMFVTLFFILIFFLISGLFTPVNAMPFWARIIAYCNPLTYFNIIIRMLYLKGSDFLDILPLLLTLMLFVLLFGATAILTHKKRSN